ncbi:FtsX-like permease family protein [Clostridium sp. C2-6-12]|uniref:FtsX-like permease family protein n=1 Tax=Clostridium sp. C2-6-12 TaxID=2698832 RepID=UPI001369726F|nr:FtsX-like permease family protein [Clostridium sp. C2-6-12]
MNTFKFLFFHAVKNLKRNFAITIFSISTVSVTFFIVGMFLLYLLSVNNSSETLFKGYNEISTVLRMAEIGIFLILPAISVLLIVSGFKMAVFIRRDEINIMKLIGATNWFIRWPFIIEGLVVGTIGAFVGNLALFILYSFISTEMLEYNSQLSSVQIIFIIKVFLSFGIAGAFIGPIANIIALRKILNSEV